MSDVPRARAILQNLLLELDLSARAKREIGRALSLMLRVPACRKAPKKRRVIDQATRRQVRRLVNGTDWTMHEIANRTGLRSGGRVSEIMHGKR